MPKYPLPPLLRGSAIRSVKAILVCTILLFAIAAAYMSFLIFERQESLSRVSHYDVAWSASQGVNEFIRLHQRITALAAEPSAERLDEVRLRFDILKGRLNLFQSGAFQAFVSEGSERRAVLEHFSAVIGQLEAMLPDAGRPATARAMLEVIAPLEGDLIGFASDAAYFSSVKITDFEGDLLRLHRNFSITAIGFFVCGLAFVALLAWHNRLLSRTQRRLESANGELERATTDLGHMARHDLLTGLANRLLFREHLDNELAEDGRLPRRVAIMCLDMDNFKNVNDSLGHGTGDALLREVARRVTTIVGEAGMVARFGGDEFVIALREAGARQAEALAARLVEGLARPYLLDGHQVLLGTSIGIAMATQDGGASPDLLLSNADLALYRAKSEGRGTYRFFEPGMDAELQNRRMIDLLLRSADFDADFELQFQPLVDLQTNQVTTVEALLRWPRTPNGAIPPADFIPVAEDNGVIVQLGAWVLKQACSVAMRLPPHVRIAVNISATQFRRSDVVQTVSRVLAQTGLAPDRLELEITETLLLDDSDQVHSALRRFRSLGVRISLDDFGTGFSSLAYLNKFAVDKVKIDRSFVSDIAESANHLAIVQAIVGLTEALGIGSVAEGVETKDQLLLIRASGCKQAQGYYFSQPLAEPDLKTFIAGGKQSTHVA